MVTIWFDLASFFPTRTPMIYSPSRLESYRQCPQKFKYTYIDKIPSEIEGVEAFMGSRVHESLEKLYTHLRFCKLLSLEELLEDYRQIWELKWHDEIRIVRAEMVPDDYLALGEKCIIDYYQRYHPFDQSRTLGIEHPVKFSLDDAGQYMIQGFIDRLSQPKDGVIWIHDYKTKGFFPTQKELDEDRQLAFYQLAIKELWPETKKVELIWHYLIFDKEIRSRRSPEELEELRQETIALIQEIEGAALYPPRQSGLCNWCEFQKICPLFRHQYETESLPENEYMGEEGVRLAGRLITLQSEEASVKGEIAKVKEALGDYARRKGVEAVFTKDHKVRIKVYENIKFPGWKDPGRPALDKLIKASGKWEEVSSLDVFALSKAVQSGKWDLEILEKVKEHGNNDPTLWIKVFPKKWGR
ncbi:MAG TPA: PD-(D/E)XK nuclease family protein [Nitrospiria bacterium]|nr:PD-(D/E)XK nuclease family protein [Candidatus Manganitrophaceae bacterium]HIL34316.1 PD-(D/E)XK nuclease family protein [Candidatus Manganitrophaceae bacterium]